MSITVRAMRAVMLAVLLMFAVGATAGALSIADARPALADDDDDDDRGGDDDDDDDRGGDDDDDDRGGDDDDDNRGGDDDDDDRGGDDDDDNRGGDDDDDDRDAAAAGDKDRVVPQGGVQTGAGGLASGTTAWTLGGAGLLAGVGAVATWLRSRGASEDL